MGMTGVTADCLTVTDCLTATVSSGVVVAAVGRKCPLVNLQTASIVLVWSNLPEVVANKTLIVEIP
jgi:hypothetical protein